MAFRFSNAGAPPLPRVGWPSTNLIFDQRLGRWRWAFQAVLEQTRDRLERDLTTAEAVTALGPELTAAFGYIASQAPDDNVFGVIYSSPGGDRVAGGDAAKGARSLKNALATIDKALAPATPDFLRGGLTRRRHRHPLQRVEGLRAERSVGHRLAGAEPPRGATAARGPGRVGTFLLPGGLGGERLSAREGQRSHPGPRRSDLPALSTALLPHQIESHALVLEVHRLYEPARLAALPLLPSGFDEVGGYIETYHVNWLHMVSESRDAMAFFQLGVGTILGMKRMLLRYFEWWKKAQLQTTRPP